MQRDRGGQAPPPWEDVWQTSGHRIIISRRKPPEAVRWLTMSPQGVAKFKYMVRCKHHDCLGPPNKSVMYVAILPGGKVRHEVEEALRVFLGENFPGDCEYTPRPVPCHPPNILYPHTEPGIHFHTLPNLAMIRGKIVAVDAGTAKQGEEGRPPMTAAGYAVGEGG